MEPHSMAPGGAQTAQTAIDFGDVSIDSFQFYDSGGYSQQAEYATPSYDVGLSGSMQHTAGYSNRADTAAGRFLEGKGFGWLLEVQDGDEEQLPLLEELDIDLKDIYYKVRCVLLPLPYFRLKLSIVRESPDFWGPLIVVLAYALLSIYGQFGVVSWILTMWFCGSFFVFFLARALGGDVGYSQVLGIVGYCLIPLVVIGLLYPIMSAIPLISSIWGLVGIGWSVYSAGSLLCVDELESKKILLLYPVGLLYFYFFSLYSGV
ncbi:hypothetical protein PENTCL1PPCAC_3217 [Pristionchus entomophagus]|uniref:Protein YIPF n=1 Tax=Pristionchus entomophagus TaxID=358040 RepID=A0AAV5SCF8_9BILA|nr:hypothetical protein PENTCL1PPCAC_3217 [Pristionchus entomophagus]